jgi:predicted secreted protein
METKLRFDRDSTDVRVARGASFVVELRAHATAGYTWGIAQAPEDVAELRDERTRPGGAALGASSVQEFEFHAMQEGSGTLVMELKRPWEPTPIEVLVLTVVVTGVS